MGTEDVRLYMILREVLACGSAIDVDIDDGLENGEPDLPDLYRRALGRGLDSAHVDSIIREYPEFAKIWKQPQGGSPDVAK